MKDSSSLGSDYFDSVNFNNSDGNCDFSEQKSVEF